MLLKGTMIVVSGLFAILTPWSIQADPAKYPQFAQQKPAENVELQFISVDDLVADIKKGTKPLIIDVRSAEEFNEAHISGARSAPLAQFRDHIKTIPRDRVTILY
jgi:3-mercaptopyruvate sulfurtransferase SseA